MAIDLKGMTRTQLADLIQRAARRQDEIASEGVQKVRDRILKLLKDEGLTFEQVFGGKRERDNDKAAGKAKAGPAHKNKGAKVKPKYRNSANPEQTWAGRGMRPRWMSEAIAAGKNEKDFLIG